MATERIVNVPINFKINTVEVERYESLLKRADQAAANLGQTSNRAASQSAAGFKSTGSSIAAMRTDLERLKTQIEITSKTDTKRLQQLSTQYKNLSSEIQKQTKLYLEQSKAIKQTAASTKDFTAQFGQLFAAARAFIAAGIVKEIVDMSINMARLTGNVEGVERAFNRTFPDADLLLANLRKATQGAVSDFELMQRTLQATNLGVDVESLPVLFEFAAARAQQTGESVDYLVDSIVRGIGRKSILILDNLGLSATRLKEQFNGASIASQSVADVTAAVGRIAQEELTKMGGLLETTATLVDQNTAAWTKLREEASKFFTEGGGAGVVRMMKEYAESFTALFKAQNRGISVAELFQERQRKEIALISVNELINRRFTESKQENIAVIEEQIVALTKSIGSWTKLRDRMQELIDIDEKELSRQKQAANADQDKIISLAQQIKFRRDIINANKEDVLIDQEILRLFQSKLVALKEIKKEQKEVNDDTAELVTDPVAFFKLGKKPPLIPMDSYRDQIVKSLQESIDKLRESEIPIVPVQIKPIIKQDEWEKAFEENRAAISDLAFNTVNEQVNSLLMADVEGYNARIDAARSFYDEQIELAGDNERRKQELRIKEQREIVELEKQRADREKKAATAGIIVSTALGIMRVFTEPSLTFADKIIKAAIVTAEGASQYAIASRARYYAKGGLAIDGPGTKTSDSIPAFLSKGESVMTTDETGSSINILKAIRAKKLNDKVLKDLMSGRSGGAAAGIFDDSKILKKLDEVKNSQPDIEMRAGLVYKGYKSGENYVKWIRSKSMGR
jgi:hypothetical protein